MRGSAQSTWDAHGELGWSGIWTHDSSGEASSAWGTQAVLAASPCCAGMEFSALPWTPREHETCTSGSGVHAHRLPVSVFLQILPN